MLSQIIHSNGDKPPSPQPQGKQRYTPPTAVFTTSDLNDPQKHIEVWKLAFMIGIERGKTLGAILKPDPKKGSISDDAKVRLWEEVKDDVQIIFKWKALGFQGSSQESVSTVLPQWIIDLLNLGLLQGVVEVSPESVRVLAEREKKRQDSNLIRS
jgi:hypothetical protein